MGQISLSHQDPKIKIAVEPHTLKAKVREASPSEIDHHDPTNHHLGHGNERCVGLYPLMMRHSALFFESLSLSVFSWRLGEIILDFTA